MLDFRNLVVFMSDGLRWDHRPQNLRNKGTTVRTIASSLHTPSSIASMLTGYYLPSHAIRGFTDILSSEMPTILDLWPNTGISAEKGNFNDEIYNYLLKRYDRIPLSETELPFAWFMRDPGGHAPFNGFDEELNSTGSVRSYLKQNAGDEVQMRRDYEKAISSSVDRFQQHVIDVLEQRDLLDETLIIFISDHGELLGEYGHVGESHPATPEIVRVPTTFIHPDIDKLEAPELMRHIDLPATISSLRGVEELPTEGEAVFLESSSPQIGLNFYDRLYPSFRGSFPYILSSVWDWNGGYVFNQSSRWNRLKLVGGYLFKIPAGIQVRRAWEPEAVTLLLKSEYSYGNPDFNKSNAKKLLANVPRTADERQTLEMNNDVKNNLEDLGYL